MRRRASAPRQQSQRSGWLQEPLPSEQPSRMAARPAQTPEPGCCCCCWAAPKLLRARLEPRRDLCNCPMAATRGEGGQGHLKFRSFNPKSRSRSPQRLGICWCWMSCCSDLWPSGRGWSQRFHWEERGIKIQTLLTAASP